MLYSYLATGLSSNTFTSSGSSSVKGSSSYAGESELIFLKSQTKQKIKEYQSN